MKLYDGKIILLGLAVFVGLFTFPFWFNMGKAAPVPEILTDTPVIAKMAVKQCVRPTDFMKAGHMQVLNEWRDTVVRDNNRVAPGTDGVMREMSLTKTCMECHSNKAEFCDRCHNYVSVAPYCWNCHLEPKDLAAKEKA
ncbi:MAG: sulfate reduction electron transfer complex DsrMKJOP subunit DsrJ [Deltaproteobacteria bacterium]|nr:sulfate reduction electron transfer complex DsrMKJOP subunit DsrJ [Deltaproteobacteria bacterium]